MFGVCESFFLSVQSVLKCFFQSVVVCAVCENILCFISEIIEHTHIVSTIYLIAFSKYPLFIKILQSNLELLT